MAKFRIPKWKFVCLCAGLVGLYAVVISKAPVAQAQSDTATDASPAMETFQAPGAGNRSTAYFCGEGTMPQSINAGGSVTGFSVDDNGLVHAFVRSPNNSYVSLNAPGADTSDPCSGTQPVAINSNGVVTGTYTTGISNGNVPEGFVRQPSGAISTFEIKTEEFSFSSTIPVGINSSGTITGWFSDSADELSHGFLRDPSGAITITDYPDEVNEKGEIGNGTVMSAMNDAGALAGYYYDHEGVGHGVLRSPDGKFILFDPPGAQEPGSNPCPSAPPCFLTEPTSINSSGTIAGLYSSEPANALQRGFLRSPDGHFTTFSFPGSISESLPVLNDARVLTGYYEDEKGVAHGFVRSADGQLTTFEAPGAYTLSSEYGPAGTRAISINAAGAVTGYYYDQNSVAHGFVRLDAPGLLGLR
jgi:hypothetical protein